MARPRPLGVMSDYHLHLHPHEPTPDGPPPGAYLVEYLERYVEAAAARGVGELAFTEHLGRCVESAEVLGPFWELEPDPVEQERTRDLVAGDRNLSLERFVDVVLRAKDRGLPVLLGLEVDFFPHTIDAVVEFLAPYPWDLLVGAVHWIGGWTFDRPWARAPYLQRGVRRVWEEYFELSAQLAASGAIDVLAHPDRIKLHGYRPPEEPLDLYQRLVAAAAAGDTALEVSSAGLRKPVDEIYPGPTLLRMSREAGLPISLASDYHSPEGAGWGHDRVVAAARAAGYTHRAAFSARKRTLVPLPDAGEPSG
jgi:histidinol-phosphatase (PHP family)